MCLPPGLDEILSPDRSYFYPHMLPATADIGLGVRVSHGLVMDFTVCVPMTVAGVRPAQTERR